MIYLGNKDKKTLSAKFEKTWLQYKENSTQTKFMKNNQHCYLHSNLIGNYGVSPKRQQEICVPNHHKMPEN